MAEKSKRKRTEGNSSNSINSVIHHVITNSIIEMNNLLWAGVYMVAEKLGKTKNSKSNEKWKKPWWKRRILGNIAERRKDDSRPNERRKDTFEFEKKDFDSMERKYKLSDVGNVQVIDMLKEKISLGTTKMRWYEERKLY